MYADQVGTSARTPVNAVIDSESTQRRDRIFEVTHGRRVGIVVDAVKGGPAGSSGLGANGPAYELGVGGDCGLGFRGHECIPRMTKIARTDF